MDLKKAVYTSVVCMLMLAGNLFSAKAQGDLSDQVVIKRTEYGVPHIQAENIRAASFAMGYLQVEDYGQGVIEGLIKARGEWAKHISLKGRALQNAIDGDAESKLRYAQAEETYALLDEDTKDLLEGYVAGVNLYITKYPEKFDEWVEPTFTAMDAHAKGIGGHNKGAVREFISSMKEGKQSSLAEVNPWERLASLHIPDHPDAGSNVWALAPERTRSGNAVLVRNPHLYWNAGYYEAHMEVPGKFNFYGDFRMGNPLGIVGGFNADLGWSTTNNYPVTHQIYGLKKDKESADSYILDGKSEKIIQKEIEVEYKEGNGLAIAKRSFPSTPYGPVIHQSKDYIFIIRDAEEGEYRTNEMFLKMMKATTLDEWKKALSMRARVRSNFTYADKAGNIFYVWNASVPVLPKAPEKNETVIYAENSRDIWQEISDWDALPQLHNPEGGYLHNENDPFHFTNLNEVFDENDFPENYPKAKLRLRSQLALELIGGSDKMSLEEILHRKHNMRVLLADRVKGELIEALSRAKLGEEEGKALRQLKKWDNTVSAKSKGSVLFDVWWERYLELVKDGKTVQNTPESAGYAADATALFRVPWNKDQPTSTPYGIANEEAAVQAFREAVKLSKERYGDWNLAWGEVHRARLGNQDYPVGGASGDLGAFRVLWFKKHAHDPKKREVSGGDGWTFAVEFGDTPKAYSILPYGNSNLKDSPYFANQLKLFSENKMKKVAYTKEDIEKKKIKEYRPGRE